MRFNKVVMNYEIVTFQSSGKQTYGLYTFLFVFLLTLITFYPLSFNSGLLVYIPQLVVGIFAVIIVIVNGVTVSALGFLLYPIIILLLTIVASDDRLSLLSLVKSHLRLFFPLLAYIIGSFFRQRISKRKFNLILLAFVISQLTISISQLLNLPFREFTYGLYRSSLLAQYLNAFAWRSGRRAIGTLGNPNTLSMIITIAMTVYLFSSPRKYKLLNNRLKSTYLNTINYIVFLLFSIVNFLITQSRTGLVIFLLIISIIFILDSYYKLRYKILICLIVIALLLLSTLLPGVSNIVFARDLKLSALLPRLDLWTENLNYFSITNKYYRIFFGLGYPIAHEFAIFDNQYLKIFISGGIIGYISFVCPFLMLYDSIRNIRKTKDQVVVFSLLIIVSIGCLLSDFLEIFSVTMVVFITLGFYIEENRFGIVSRARKKT